jgi:hypothetical protein
MNMMMLLKILMIVLLVLLINVGYSYSQSEETETTTSTIASTFRQQTTKVTSSIFEATTKSPERQSLYDYIKFILGKIRGFIGFL